MWKKVASFLRKIETAAIFFKFFLTKNNRLRVKNYFMYSILRCSAKIFIFQFVSVAENAEKKISIQLYHNKYFYGNFNSNFSLQNKQLQHFVLVVENIEKKISIKLYDNKYFYENFNLNFSLQNKQLQQIDICHIMTCHWGANQNQMSQLLKMQRKKFP